MEQGADQKQAIESATQPIAVHPPTGKRSWLKILLLVFFLVFAVTVIFLAGVKVGKNRPEWTPGLPTVTLPPDKPLSGEENLTTDWKTHINSFGKFSVKYPPLLSVDEKLFSEKNRQIAVSGTSGILTINLASSDYSPGWGGGCEPQDKKTIIFMGESKIVCEGETWLNQLYFSHPDGSRNFQISATFNPPYGQSKEEILQILSTFKFLD